MKRSKLWAIVGACVLTLGLANVALAITLSAEYEALVAGWDSNGDPFAEDSAGEPLAVNPDSCEGFGVEDGEIVFHFVQSGDAQDVVSPNPGGASANLLDVDLNDGEIFLEDVEASDVALDAVEWLVSVDPPGDELELVSATSNVDGGELVVAAICIGAVAGQTDAPTEPATSAIEAATPVGPADGAWLLVAALGVLLGSIVVLNPTRARPRR